MNRVFLRGCEAEYLGALVRTSEFCPNKNTTTMEGGYDVSREYPESTAHSHGSNSTAQRGKDGRQSQGHEEGSGTLVMHIRSGDIFGKVPSMAKYGQVRRRVTK